MKKIIILSACLLSLGMFNYTWANVFDVIDVQGFQDALTDAQSNGQDDTINVAAGVYDLDATLEYATDENFALTIAGDIGGSTILDGGGLNS